MSYAIGYYLHKDGTPIVDYSANITELNKQRYTTKVLNNENEVSEFLGTIKQGNSIKKITYPKPIKFGWY